VVRTAAVESGNLNLAELVCERAGRFVWSRSLSAVEVRIDQMDWRRGFDANDLVSDTFANPCTNEEL
jgi:hypothetical protein